MIYFVQEVEAPEGSVKIGYSARQLANEIAGLTGAA